MSLTAEQPTGQTPNNNLRIGLLIIVVIIYITNYKDINAWFAVKSAPKAAPGTPVDTPLGGVTDAASPAAQAPVHVPAPAPSPVYVPAPEPVLVVQVKQVAPPLVMPQAPLPVTVMSTPIVAEPQIKTIEISKNSATMQNKYNDNPDWKTFQIGEVRAYNQNGELLNADKYSSAVYTSGDGGYSTPFPAMHAIDGNPRTFTHTSGLGDLHALVLTLKEPTIISKVEILNRHDCCQTRLEGALITLRNTEGNTIMFKNLTSGMLNVVQM